MTFWTSVAAVICGGGIFLFGISILYVVLCFIKRILQERHAEGKHHCNQCKCSFLFGGETEYLYCPYCGKELGFHEEMNEALDEDS